MAKAEQAFSEGARYERAAIRQYLRRRLRDMNTLNITGEIHTVIEWVLARQKRYDKHPGGLGKR